MEREIEGVREGEMGKTEGGRETVERETDRHRERGRERGREKRRERETFGHSTLMQSSAACLASWFSVDGPLCPDCSAPLNVNQLTKLNTADSPLR